MKPATCIDFHSHILPGADHGSRNLSESLAQLAMLESFGVDTVVATPHFYPNSMGVDRFLRVVDSASKELSDHRPATSPRIAIGAEVLYCDGLERMEGLDHLCIRGTNVLLLELPLEVWSSELFHTVERLTQRFTVLLAHIDRYIVEQEEEIHALLGAGAYAQVNAAALASLSKRRRLSPLWDTDRIVALGSDLHKTEKKACRAMHSAEKRLGDRFDVIMNRAAALLSNAEFLN